MARKKKSAETALKTNTYTDEDILKVLALYNLYHNQAQVARETGIPATTVNRWINNIDMERRKELMGNFDHRLQQTQNRLMNTMAYVADEALTQIHKKIDSASAAQAATIYGILFDKQQIMAGNSGGPSSVTFNLNGISQNDAADLMQRVLDRTKQSNVIQSDAKIIDSVEIGSEE